MREQLRASAALGTLLALWLVGTARPADPPAPVPPAFDGRRAQAIVAELAGDSRGGRKSGTESGRLAEDYVAERFTAWGLTGAGDGGSYFQPLALLATEERGAELELCESPYGAVSFLYGDDFALVTNSGSGDVAAEVVVVGHGLCDPRRAWDDYGDIDVGGRVVLIVRGKPDNGYDWEQADTRDSTLHEAMRRGAAAVLYSQGPRPVHGGAIHDGSYFPAVPIAYVGHRVVEHLFMDTGVSREAYERELGRHPKPFATGKRVRIRTDVALLPQAGARNVIAQLPGSDPRLRDEIIVIGGHLDHLGADGRGLVYNGANDNASGTSVVMELARSLAQSPWPLARTIVFVAFAGEEQGLLGSEALVKAQAVDLDRVVTMINLDMVGHGDGRVGIGGGEFFPQVWRSFLGSLESSLADSLDRGRAWGGEGSDHAPFRRAGIPTGNIWSEGDHHFYHSIQDDPAWVDAAVLGAVGRMGERWLRALADWPAPLAGPHRAGRALLNGSLQVDFDGGLPAALPECVRAQVRWFDAGEFGRSAFLDTVGGLAGGAADPDAFQLVDGLSGVGDATWGGRRAALIGLRHALVPARAGAPHPGGVPPERAGLLDDLHIAMACWRSAQQPGEPGPLSGEGHATAVEEDGAGAEGSAAGVEEDVARSDGYLRQLVREHVTLLVPGDTTLVRSLPSGAEVCVRVFPQRGERLDGLAGLPPRKLLVVVSLENAMGARALARDLRHIGAYRAHLDLVPWMRNAGDSSIWAFLEELQEAGSFEVREMRAMLGGNLERL